MKKYKFNSVIFMLLVLVGFAAFAGSGQHNAGEGKFMRFFDTNKDGLVTLDEFTAASKERFSRMDVDANGVVMNKEFRNYIRQRRAVRHERKFKKLDGNQDGQMSIDEFLDYKKQRAEKRFQMLDTDNNGLVTQQEFSSSRNNHHSRQRGNYKGKQGHHKHRRGGKKIFKKMDKNNDGQVTREESQQSWSAWFDRIDVNKDATVTADEVKVYRETKMKRRWEHSE